MPFAAGTRLGPYEIIGTLGAGGMGEVYRARDTRLGREVAIKILPVELSSNQDRLNRFEQEAHSASSLNHPNIITIHDIGSSDSTRYIAMELVDGKTLRELISSGPVAPRKAISIAAQMAEGLAKAHSAGIIHRDLKPENVMITKDGFVKILDFGLAKLFAADKQEGVSSLQTAAGTNAGMILGTIGYMSPEQASGEQVDFRSDQFSLGSILYEMVTGQRAFQKKSTVETMAAIINQDPLPIASINPQVPAPIRWFIERCLAKDPADRFASTDDLARDLKSIRDHISEISATGDTVTEAIRPQKSRKHFLNAWSIAALFVIAALATALFFSVKSTAPTSSNSAPNYHRVTYSQGRVTSGKFTPDGQTIVYSAAMQGKAKELYMTRTEGVESRPLGITNEDILSVSSAGMLVLLPKGVLAQVPLNGGSPRELSTNVTGAAWFPDGTRMAIGRKVGGKGTLEVPPGKVIYESPFNLEMIRISPKADLIAFNERTFGSNGTVVMVDLNGKKRATTKEIYPFGVVWSPGEEEVWYTSWNMESGRGSVLRGLSPTGRDRLIQNFPFITSLLDISSNGHVLLSFDEGRKITRARLAGEASEQDVSLLDGSEILDFSPDGKTMLFHESYEASDAPSGTIYIRNIDGSPAIRLASGAPSSFSPDGKWVAGINGDDMILVPTGAGEIKKISTMLKLPFPTAFLPNGKQLLVYGREKGKGVRFYVMDLSNGHFRPVTPELGLSNIDDVKRLSYNGEFFFLNDLNQEFFIYPIEEGERSVIPGILEGELPFQWSADSRSVFVCNAKFPMQVFKVDVKTGKRMLFTQLLLSDYSGIESVDSVRISPDESSYAYSYLRTISTVYLVDGLK